MKNSNNEEAKAGILELLSDITEAHALLVDMQINNDPEFDKFSEELIREVGEIMRFCFESIISEASKPKKDFSLIKALIGAYGVAAGTGSVIKTFRFMREEKQSKEN